ncbi:MAG: phage portal protein [Clostridia bacterium]|nr:phage portal protein [Clostridia bacterium]
MNIFKHLFHSRDKPKNALNGSEYNFYFGGTSSGKCVNERTSLQITAVYTCIRVIAEAIAGLPLHLYKSKSEGKEKAKAHPLYSILHDEPNPEMTSFVFRETLMGHLLLYGNAYAQIIRNGRGDVMGLYPLMPNKMQVDRASNGEIYYTYILGSGDSPEIKNNKTNVVYLRRSDVLHIPGLGYDGIVGYSPIALAKNTIGMAIACEEYGAKFFANDASPSGILEHPGILNDPEKLRKSWNEMFSGSGNSHKIAVLEEGLQFKNISVSPNEAQFLETRQFQLNEIARIFRVPPHMVGDLERSTFSNIEEQSLEFVKYTLAPWISRWEQSLKKALLNESEKKDYFIQFNVDGLLRGDYQSRMNGYSIGIQNGFLSVNDVRSFENMDLLPDSSGGNEYLVNGTMTKLSEAGAAYKDEGDDANE